MKIALPYAAPKTNAFTRFFRLLLAREWTSHEPGVDYTAEKPYDQELRDEIERRLSAG